MQTLELIGKTFVFLLIVDSMLHYKLDAVHNGKVEILLFIKPLFPGGSDVLTLLISN
jgi:hypothetical protein